MKKMEEEQKKKQLMKMLMVVEDHRFHQMKDQRLLLRLAWF